MTTRKLGSEQESILRSIREHRRWYRGDSWIWSTRSKTERLLDSLVRRGLVAVTDEHDVGAKGRLAREHPPRTHRVYRPVEEKGE